MGISFNPFPEFIKNDLRLRQLSLSDENEIFLLRSDEMVQKYLDRPFAKTLDDAREFIKKVNNGISENEWIYWAITPLKQETIAGTICLWNFSWTDNKAEIGYELLPDYHGKGIMQEAINIILDYAFNTLMLASVDAILVPENLKSVRVLERNNFIKVHKPSEYSSDKTITYYLTKENFKPKS
jgi:[ribosomal protein S5]-alanine N-acetyltransferase